ncbi:hypothetical protein AgCh_004160 [Apium graveolens]
MKKDSAKLEVILNEKCLCYNEDSSHPRVIRLDDGLERNHISALRTAIYQIGSQNEEMNDYRIHPPPFYDNSGPNKLASGFRWVIGDGQTVVAARDPWLDKKDGFKVDDIQLYDGRAPKVAALFHPSTKVDGAVFGGRQYRTKE